MMLEYRNITHTYTGYSGEEVQALRSLNLSISEQEFLVILGPSGCGKSTLLNMAAGFVAPTGGSVLFRGEPVRSPGRKRAMVFQDAALLPWMSVAENILLAMKDQDGYGRDEVNRVLEVVGLRGFDHAMPHELSVGMRQKTAIARSLVMGAPLLLMDEPFASLDEQTRLRLNREVVDIWLREQRTILFVTHSIQEALVLGTRVVLMSARPGCIVEQWELPGEHGSGEERQKERLGAARYRGLAAEILGRMELCCPPGSDCACRCR